MNNKSGVWFVYDGECFLCSNAARALRIQEECGPLHLVDARKEKDSPLLKSIRDYKLDLDEGMVIFHQEKLYHGKDALRFMAIYGAPKGIFNKLNRFLFQSDKLSEISYPVMRGIRNFLLRLRNIPKIANLNDAPIFESIFGSDL